MANLIASQAAMSNHAQAQPSLRERLADDLSPFEMALFDKSLYKGFVLNKMMLADSATAGQMMHPPRPSAESVFQSVSDIQDSGYVEDKDGPLGQHITLENIGEALTILGMNSSYVGLEVNDDIDDYGFVDGAFDDSGFIEGSSDTDMQIDSPKPTASNHSICHELFMDNESGDKLATAVFMQVINPSDGIIVAYDNVSPLQAIADCGFKDDGLTVPGLRFWSDVAFLQWKSRAVGAELKYVLRHNVENSPTVHVVESIHVANGSATVEWPGVSYDVGSQEGMALLGTPNGSGVAWMLVQHKEYFGRKTVGKVTVFHVDNQLMLLFHIVDVVV